MPLSVYPLLYMCLGDCSCIVFNRVLSHSHCLLLLNQGAHTIAGGLKWEQGAEPPLAPLTLTTGDEGGSSAKQNSKDMQSSS